MDDHIIRAVAWDGRVRVAACESTATVEELRRIHDPSPMTTAAIGRLATGALLMTSMLEKVTRREPMVTLEIDGNGPAGKLLATASPRGWVRAMVSNPLATAESKINGKLNVAGVVGDAGELIVTRDPGVGEPYRGVVSLVSGEIAQDLAHYLLESEQTPSAVLLGVHVVPEGRVGHSGGLMIQLLPGVSDDEAAELASRVRDLGPVTSKMAAGAGPVSWLEEIFVEDLAVLETNPVRFFCGCSRERVETALMLLGADEIRAMIADSGGDPTVMHCGFCRSEYSVTVATLQQLLQGIQAGDPGGRPN
jgi:molecular chaperone Hsp33